jgi:arginase
MTTATADRITVLGAPSTAGAYAPGQEEVPRLLRDRGLVDRLRGTGADIVDAGDTPFFRWTPDRTRPRAQHVARVAANAGAIADATEAALAGGGRRVLVLGGDCTTATGVVAGLRRTSQRCGLVYLDRHPDMNTPESVADGALDWMGMAHMLALPGTEPAVVEALGPAPLLTPAQVVLLATDETQYTAWEREQIATLGIHAISWQAVADAPDSTGREALGAFGDADAIAVHFDLDVLDFTDAPLSQAVLRNTGITLDQAAATLATLLADPRVRALSVSELQPAHTAGDPDVLERLIGAITAAFSS